MIRFERTQRFRSGCLVSYQNVEVEELLLRYRQERYVLLILCWVMVEVWRGCYVLLPPCLTYLGYRFIMAPSKSLWCIPATQGAVYAAAYFLWEAYD